MKDCMCDGSSQGEDSSLMKGDNPVSFKPEAFPNSPQVVFKEKFVERYSQLTDFEAFKCYSLAYPRKSIRVNILKITPEELRARLLPDWELTPIPWCKEGFWIENVKDGRRDVGNLREHALGYFYVQDASSMIPPVVLDPQLGEVVLDMCAAPGSKTTQLVAMMQNTGLVIANDMKGVRLAALDVNLQRVGATNALSTLMYGQRYKQMGFSFDRILVDAPCSGTGTVNKSLKTLMMWNPGMVKRLSYTQKKLLLSAYSVLKPGGIMTYSTCSCEPQENEGVVSEFVKETGAKVLPIELAINSSPPVMSFEGEEYDPAVKNCLRIWPQDNHTEGFFVTKLQKPL